MKIDLLEIRSRFKNLERVKVDFDEDHLMTVIVGRNGSGKSNVLEALVNIFRNLDLGQPPTFSYLVRYKLDNNDAEDWVEVDADPARGTLAKQYQIKVGKNKEMEESAALSIHKLKRDKDGNAKYLPDHVFAYYSGPSDRLENLFRKHRDDFYDRLLKDEIDIEGNIRPLFYAKPSHSQFVLLAFFLSEASAAERSFIRDQLGIADLDSVHFVLRRPGWSKSAEQRSELFWSARGVVRTFLDVLFEHVIAPIKVTRGEDLSFKSDDKTNEFFHLFLPSLKALRAAAKGWSPDVLFKMLESTLLSEMLSEVNVRVKVTSCEAPLTFRELSEGEQQLLTVLGLLKFTGSKNSLFLLDEPDTHLNPVWAAKYLKFLGDFLPNHETSHVLMVTHHPLAIAELLKEQVQVMGARDSGHIEANPPEENPRGMGINLILRSDMFGLQTTLDDDTNDKLARRNYLASAEQPLHTDEISELKRLNEQLESLGFTLSTDDADYMDFLRERYHSDETGVKT